MANPELDAVCSRLSSVQKRAVEWEKGSLLVLAGPGSGKTNVLTCRIARILDSTRGQNFRILGLTFTNKAADEMRSRVTTFVPGQEGRVFLGTFHSFCSDVLRQHGVHLGINPNFHIYALDKDLQEILDKAVEDARDRSDLISDLDRKTLPVIQRLKSLLIYPEKCSKMFRDPEFAKRMSIVYPAYENALAEANALDFNSLIFKAYQLFTKFPALAKRYRTVYPFVCVDEFQDTNHAQYELIRAITGDSSANLFVVADDDQIIYQWNGASHKRLEQFVEDYAPEILQLPMNYRCPAPIVDLANNLIRNNFLRKSDKAPLTAYRTESTKGAFRLLHGFSSFEDEGDAVAIDIKTRHSANLNSVVILARNRKLLEGAQQALSQRGLPSFIAQRKDEFLSTPILWLQSVLTLANDRKSYSALEIACGTFGQLTSVQVDPENVFALSQETDGGFLSLWIDSASILSADPDLKYILSMAEKRLLGPRDFLPFCDDALAWFDKLSQVKDSDTDNGAVELFARYEEEKIVWRELVREIRQALGDEMTLEAFLQELQMHSKEPPPRPNTLILMTIHGAKGKEFDHVYLIGMVEDELPSFQSKKKGNSSPELEEERRNCFVAITRTIKTLTLSFADRYRGWPKSPSRFLFEMGILKQQQ